MGHSIQRADVHLQGGVYTAVILSAPPHGSSARKSTLHLCPVRRCYLADREVFQTLTMLSSTKRVLRLFINTMGSGGKEGEVVEESEWGVREIAARRKSQQGGIDHLLGKINTAIRAGSVQSWPGDL